MIDETIIAKKDSGLFFNYTILARKIYTKNKHLNLLINLISTRVLQDVFDYEIGINSYEYGSSDEWSVVYGDISQHKHSYIECYDYWTEQEAVVEKGNNPSGVIGNNINSLKILTKANLMEIMIAWQKIYKEKPLDIIASSIDGRIILQAKEELSKEDLEFIEKEK